MIEFKSYSWAIITTLIIPLLLASSGVDAGRFHIPTAMASILNNVSIKTGFPRFAYTLLFFQYSMIIPQLIIAGHWASKVPLSMNHPFVYELALDKKRSIFGPLGREKYKLGLGSFSISILMLLAQLIPGDLIACTGCETRSYIFFTLIHTGCMFTFSLASAAFILWIRAIYILRGT